MPPWVSDEMAIRLTVFGAAFLLLALIEIAAPRRQAPPARMRRWPTNLGLMALGAVLSRIALPLAVVEAGALATDRGWGLLGAAGVARSPLGVAGAVIALDFAIYAQPFYEINKLHSLLQRFLDPRQRYFCASILSVLMKRTS